jgi:REP element-mobilizing transposase RayT
MARKLRVQYPGAIYHVMNRGDHLEPIFRDEKDPELFLATLSESSTKADWQVHALCLMSNHFHIVLETPRGNLVEGMKWLLGTYTSRFNRKHQVFRHLFSGRYKGLPVDGSDSGYLNTACDYVSGGKLMRKTAERIQLPADCPTSKTMHMKRCECAPLTLYRHAGFSPSMPWPKCFRVNSARLCSNSTPLANFSSTENFNPLRTPPPSPRCWPSHGPGAGSFSPKVPSWDPSTSWTTSAATLTAWPSATRACAPSTPALARWSLPIKTTLTPIASRP